MSFRDAQGNRLSGATAEGRARFAQGLRLLQCYSGDPLAEADAAPAQASRRLSG